MKRNCPDGGVCHHDCDGWACFRVRTCGPLSGVYEGDRWPDYLRQAFGREPRPYIPRRVVYKADRWWVVEIKWSDHTVRLVREFPHEGVILTWQDGEYAAHPSTWVTFADIGVEHETDRGVRGA